MRRRRRRKNKSTGLGLIIFIVFSICGMFLLKKQSLNQEYITAYARMEELEKAIEEEQEIAKILEDQEAYMQTRKFIEDVARNKFGLVYEDEYMFKANEE